VRLCDVKPLVHEPRKANQMTQERATSFTWSLKKYHHAAS